MTARRSQGEAEMLAVGTPGRRSGQHCGTRPQGIATVTAVPVRTCLIRRSRIVGAPPLLEESPSTEATNSSVRRNLNAEIAMHQAFVGELRSRRHLPHADASERRG